MTSQHRVRARKAKGLLWVFSQNFVYMWFPLSDMIKESNFCFSAFVVRSTELCRKDLFSNIFETNNTSAYLSLYVCKLKKKRYNPPLFNKLVKVIYQTDFDLASHNWKFKSRLLRIPRCIDQSRNILARSVSKSFLEFNSLGYTSKIIR